MSTGPNFSGCRTRPRGPEAQCRPNGRGWRGAAVWPEAATRVARKRRGRASHNDRPIRVVRRSIGTANVREFVLAGTLRQLILEDQLAVTTHSAASLAAAGGGPGV